MNRKEATTSLGKVINEGELPDLAAIYVAHQNLKRVEKVVGKLRRLWDRAGEETSFCAEYKREEIEYMLTLLTEEE